MVCVVEKIITHNELEYEFLNRKKMTVKDLIKRLKLVDQDRMVIITDGEGWSNIDKIETKGLSDVHIVMEREPLFSN